MAGESFPKFLNFFLLLFDLLVLAGRGSTQTWVTSSVSDALSLWHLLRRSLGEKTPHLIPIPNCELQECLANTPRDERVGFLGCLISDPSQLRWFCSMILWSFWNVTLLEGWKSSPKPVLYVQVVEFNAEISNNANKKPALGCSAEWGVTTETSNLCGLLWVYALSGANIGVSQGKQGILVFLWNAVCNLLWKVGEEQTTWACLCSHDPWLRKISEIRNIR